MPDIGSVKCFGFHRSVLIAGGRTILPTRKSFGLWSDHNNVKKLGKEGWRIKIWASYHYLEDQPKYFYEISNLSIQVRGYTERWTRKYGLIYTNSSFQKAVQNLLKDQGIPGYKNIGYTEQGMQGSDYVSMEDHSDIFTKWLLKKYGSKFKVDIDKIKKLRRLSRNN